MKKTCLILFCFVIAAYPLDNHEFMLSAQQLNNLKFLIDKVIRASEESQNAHQRFNRAIDELEAYKKTMASDLSLKLGCSQSQTTGHSLITRVGVNSITVEESEGDCPPIGATGAMGPHGFSGIIE